MISFKMWRVLIVWSLVLTANHHVSGQQTNVTELETSEQECEVTVKRASTNICNCSEISDALCDTVILMVSVMVLYLMVFVVPAVIKRIRKSSLSFGADSLGGHASEFVMYMAGVNMKVDISRVSEKAEPTDGGESGELWVKQTKNALL